MSSLNIFSVPSTDYDFQGYKMVPFSKLSTSITPMKFSVQALEDYVDLNRSYFVIDLRLYSSSQNGIVADANATSDANNTRFVYAVNNLAQTIFKQINLRFNGTLMSEQTDTYAYSAFFQSLLNYNRDDGETLLQPQGWVNFLNVVPTLAAGGVNDDISTTANWAHGDTNALKTLTVPFRGNAVVRLIMRPYLPAFHTGKVMVPGVEMNFELHFNSPNFYTFSTLTSGTGVKRYVTLREQDVDITLHLCRLSLNPDVYSTLEGERKLRKQVVKYPVVRDQIRTFTFNLLEQSAPAHDRGDLGQHGLQWGQGKIPVCLPEQRGDVRATVYRWGRVPVRHPGTHGQLGLERSHGVLSVHGSRRGRAQTSRVHGQTGRVGSQQELHPVHVEQRARRGRG